MFISKLISATFKAPDYIPKDDRPTFYALMLGGWTGFFLHCMMLGVFYSQDIYALTIVNIFSLIIWIFVLLLFYKGDLVNGLYLSCFEIIAHAIFVVSTLGTDYGLHFYLISVACMLSIEPRVKLRSGLVLGLFCLFVFVSMYFLYPQKTELVFFDEYVHMIFIGGFLSALLPVILGIYQMKTEYLNQRQKLEKLASFDMLTGLHNRRFFYSFLEEQNALAKKQNKAFCIALADIDNFKLVNDKHGHDVGDDVLVEVANFLSSVLAEDHGVCRWGGEEFIVFLPMDDLDAASKRLNEFRDKMSQLSLTRKSLAVTMSYGLIKMQFGESIDDYVKRADRLLYQAKLNGRNRVEIVLA